jgi:7-cyano-7-deazaguanine reductase
MKKYANIDKTILKSLPNPKCGGGHGSDYEIKLDIPEFTFLGVPDQPDFGHIEIKMVPDSKIIELKSLKYYVGQYRNIVVSYERAIQVMYEHMMDVYEPKSLVIVMKFRPRGGISSTLTADSSQK